MCMSYSMTGGPGKEQGTNKPAPARRVQQRSKGDTTGPTTFQNPPWQPFGWTRRAPPGRTLSQNDWLMTTNPITIKPVTASQVAELFSWVPFPSCSPPGCPFPVKSLALSARVSPRTTHFRVLETEPSFWPWKGFPFLQQGEQEGFICCS